MARHTSHPMSGETLTASKVWAVLLLALMFATLALSVWGMIYHSRYWFLVLPLVLATAALAVVPFLLALFVLGGCDFGSYEF